MSLNPRTIVNSICEQHGMDPVVMRSPRRNRRCVAVRRAVAKELREQGMSLTDIGEWIGGRSHATVGALLKEYSR